MCVSRYFSPSSLHRRRELDSAACTNTFQEIQFLLNLQCCWRTFSVSLSQFLFERPHTDGLSSFCVPPRTGVFSLWLTSRSRRLWRSTWWRRSNANITARDATVFFCLLSLSLPHLRYLFSVSLRLSLHACFSAALWFICGKTKKEKMLSFYLFFFCQVSFSCISSSATKPFSPSVSLHPSVVSSLLRYEYNDSITVVNDNLTAWGSL